MEHSRLRHKRPLIDQRPPVCMKKPSLDWYQSGWADRARQPMSCGGAEACLNEVRNQAGSFFEVLESWKNTKNSVSRVLEHLEVSQDVFLSNEVNQKFLEFHRDITEECGPEWKGQDKQHSWAVIEKPVEIIFYGPYFPDQSRGEHSEDAVVQQTQELLETDGVTAHWKIYIFTQNSPCLARSAEPCMVKLARKALEWWNEKGVKTHIRYLNCWGFKGFKENLFKDLNYSHLVCIEQSRGNHVLRPLTLPMIKPEQGPDWKGPSRRPHARLPADESFARQANAGVEAARRLLSERSESLGECVERGYAFGSRSDTRDGVRATPGRCREETAEEKYAEFIREELRHGFNRCAVQIFCEDVANFEYLQIGKVRFPKRN